MNNNSPLLSILCPTYNHEKFIKEALCSFLNQKTNFTFEIIVHDDASIDNTIEIVKIFENKYPNIFNNIYQKENQLSKDISSVTRIMFSHAKGKYIALCEGDDYWTDPFKLQKQVDFLEANPEYIGSVHNGMVCYQETSFQHPYLNLESDREISSDESLISLVGLTPSFVFKNILTDFDFKVMSSKNYFGGDRMLFVLLSRFGKFYFHNEIMCCYRKHSNGMTSVKKNSFFTRDEIKILQLVKKKFSTDIYPGINKAILLAKIKLANQLAENKSFKFISPLSSSIFNIKNYQSLKIFIKDGLLKSFKVLIIK